MACALAGSAALPGRNIVGRSRPRRGAGCPGLPATCGGS